MTTPSHGNGNGAAVTLREVYALIKEVRADISVEIGKAVAGFNDKLQEHNREHTDHDQEHAKHEAQHQRDAQSRKSAEDRRASLIRWSVTSILTGAGVMAAIIIPLVTK